MQTVSNDFSLRLELGLVSKLLKIAATAATKIGARRFDTKRGRFENLNYGRETHLSLNPINFYAQQITGRGKRVQSKRVSIGEVRPGRSTSTICSQMRPR